MASHSKTAVQTAVQASSSMADMVGEWIRQGTEGFIATQKILLDLAAQQNALALTIVRERLSFLSISPKKAAVELVSKGTHNLFEVQRALLDLLARQNEILSEGLKPGVEGTKIEGLAEVLHQGLGNFIDMQKKLLEIFEAETDSTIKNFGEGKMPDTEKLTESARDGLRTFLHSQKNFLDIVEKEVVDKRIEPVEKSEKEKIDLFEVAKKSVDSFVKAQEQLLDVASEQVNATVTFTKEAFKPERPAKPITTLPDVVKKSVDSFVAAQKALVEVASKPRKPAETVVAREPDVVIAKA